MEIKEVEFVDLIFENCEYIRVPFKYFIYFNLEGVKHCIYKHQNTVGHYDIVNDIYLVLDKSFNDLQYIAKFSENDKGECTGEKMFERMSFGDLSGLDIKYTDGNNELYYVDYDEGENEGKLGAPNINQNSGLDNENLHIRISADDNSLKFKREC